MAEEIQRTTEPGLARAPCVQGSPPADQLFEAADRPSSPALLAKPLQMDQTPCKSTQTLADGPHMPPCDLICPKISAICDFFPGLCGP